MGKGVTSCDITQLIMMKSLQHLLHWVEACTLIQCGPIWGAASFEVCVSRPNMTSPSPSEGSSECSLRNESHLCFDFRDTIGVSFANLILHADTQGWNTLGTAKQAVNFLLWLALAGKCYFWNFVVPNGKLSSTASICQSHMMCQWCSGKKSCLLWESSGDH